MIKYELISPIQPGISMIEQILKNRGINNIKEFLNIEDNYIPPNTINYLKNVQQGVEMLIKHIKNNDTMLVQVDSDCDGFTSAAVFINYLNKLFPHYVQSKVFYRLHDEKVHGLISIDTIPKDTKIIVIPDAGSNEFELHKKCKELGIDILILDHHVAEYESSDACVINNQLCDYPTKSLSGVGIVYKFFKYIDSLLNINNADRYLDLVSLGMIADMMDTRDFETQYLIQKGLTQIRNPLFLDFTRRDEMHFPSGETPTMTAVAWYVAPIINSVTRVGTPEEKILVFEAMLESKAYEEIPSTKRGCSGQTELRVAQASRTAANIKNRQNTDVDNAIKFVKTLIEKNNLLSHKVIIICVEDKCLLNKNLNGLVANKLAADYQRPALVLQKVDDTWQGSARGYDKSSLKNFQQFLLNSNLVEYATGHPNAFGVGIKDEVLQTLIDYCDTNLTMIDGSIKYDVDFIWDALSLNPTDIINIGVYKWLWGQKIEEPKIALTNLKLTDSNLRFIGKNGKTLRIDLKDTSIIKFFCSDDEIEKFQLNGETWIANAIVTCDINEWNGRTSAQLKLVDLDIIRKQKWDF